MSQPPPPTPERFFNTLNAHQQSAALKTALELGLFSAIAQGHRTPESLAHACKIAPRGARILADFLTILGFLTKQDSHYSLSPDAAMFLDRKSPAYLGDAVEFLHNPHMRTQFDNLTERVRLGGAPKEDNALAPNHEVWVKFARAMSGLMFMPAQALAQQVLAARPDTSHPFKVLDIAAGHGMFGLAFAKQNPHAHVVAQDWSIVLTVALENAAKFGVADRFLTLPGSAFDVHFGTGYDIILIPNFLHHFDAPTCVTLLKKCHAALNPGGIAVTLEFAPDDNRLTPPGMAAFSLVMLASTPAGDAHTVSEITAMYHSAGFQNARSADLPGGMQRIITGTN